MSSPVRSNILLDDPFRLGWRYVQSTDNAGHQTLRQVPLTEHDLLFPQEGDLVVQRDAHTRDMLYLREAFRTVLSARPDIRVLADHRVDFDLEGIEPLGPDVAVLENMAGWNREHATIYLAEEGSPLLIAEITSTATRRNDLGSKREFYLAAEVPFYVVVDHLAAHGVELIVWALRRGNYERLEPDLQGRIYLNRLNCYLALVNGEVWVYRSGGDRIEETPQLQAALDQARWDIDVLKESRERLEEEMEQQVDLRQQAQREATHERNARQAAEEARRLAEERASQETESRRLAEERAEREAEARRQAEERAADLERRLRELEGQGRSQPAE